MVDRGTNKNYNNDFLGFKITIFNIIISFNSRKNIIIEFTSFFFYHQ